MKKKPNILIILVILLFTTFSNVAAFDITVAPVGSNDIIEELDTPIEYEYGSSDKIYSWRAEDGTSMFCLDIGKHMAASVLLTEQETVTNSGIACGLYEAYKDLSKKYSTSSQIVSAIDTPTGKTHINYDYIVVQKRLWEYQEHKGSCVNPVLSTENYTAGTISLTSSNTVLKLNSSGTYYVSSPITVNTSGLNSTTYNISITGSNGVFVSTTPGGNSVTSSDSKTLYINIPASSATEKLTATLKVTGSYNSSKQVIGKSVSVRTFKPHIDDYQRLGIVNMSVEEKTTQATTSSTLVFENNVGTLIIKKIDSKNSNKTIEGAKFKLIDSNGTPAKYADGTDVGELTTDSKGQIVLNNLPYDTYKLQEIYAPSGYKLKTDLVVVVFNSNNKTVTINNEKTTTKITKYDATGKKELPGATLEIQDEDGNIVKYCTDEDGNSNSECKWISTDKPYEIEGLPSGTYYLVETIAPKGYVLNKEKVQFVVKDDGSVTEVSMTNELEVEVPDTLGSRASILLTIAMFFIALGIGIVTYVKKNKIEQ